MGPQYIQRRIRRSATSLKLAFAVRARYTMVGSSEADLTLSIYGSLMKIVSGDFCGGRMFCSSSALLQ